MLICGIDIGKNYHEACVIDETGRQLAKTLRFPNTTAGAGTLMDYFHGGNPDKQAVRGSPHLRRAIWLASTVAAFHDPVLSAFYQKKRAEGKHHCTAIGAVARKLTLIIYAVLRNKKAICAKLLNHISQRTLSLT